MNPETAIAAAVTIPLLAALIIPLARHRPNLREGVTIVAGVLTFASVLTLVDTVTAGGRPSLGFSGPVLGFELGFEVEPLGLLFGLVASGLWIVTSLYSIGYMRGHAEKNQTRFFVCFAIAISTAIGIAFARDLLTLFLFYEALTLSTYPLVTHAGSPEAMRAGRVYLGILLSTSIGLLLLAIIWTWQIAGTLAFTPGGILAGRAEPLTLGILLALFVFGTGKAAVMPFHRWLPAAMVAPAPVSALLHAVAVVKAGVFTVLKVGVYIFGLDTLSVAGSTWLPWVASATILIASLVALTKDNLKARLAYSTVSQLSYIVLGVALATPASIVGSALHLAMHAMGKITLFFCAGAIAVAAHKTEVSELDGIGRAMPFTMAAFFVASLSIIGLPPLGGSWSKWYLALGAADGERFIFVAVLMLSSLLSVGYLLPIVGRAFYPVGRANLKPLPRKEAPMLCVVPLCLTAFGCLVLFVFADRLQRWLAPLGGIQ